MKRWIKKVFSAFVFAGLTLLGQAAFSADLTQIRFGKQDAQTIRFVAHVNQKVETNVFMLQNPTRIVIDFDRTNLKKSVSEKITLPNILIEKVRFGQAKNNGARVVLEVKGMPSFDKGFFLSPTKKGDEWRFVLDIKSSGNKEKTAVQPVVQKAPPQVQTEQKERIVPKTETRQTQKPVIVLDPGHGGADPGAISLRGRYEKNLTLQMGHEVRKALEKTGRYKVYMTREVDKSLTLRGRMKFAHQKNADLFISIHADSAKNRNAKGLSVYTISEKASDKEAMALAERENKADIILGMDLSNETPEVSNILIDLAKRDTMEKSSHYANLLVDEMSSRVQLVPNAHRFAGFVVLKSPNVPSVLLEIGYLSNKQEEKLLHQADYRARLTKAIVSAVNRYFDSLYE